MSFRWRERKFSAPSAAVDVANATPRDHQIELDDVVVLYLLGDIDDNEIAVRVTRNTGLEWDGVIARASRLGASGTKELAPGDAVTFCERHIFRLEKA